MRYTDTFGNVIQEAAASGAPAIVTSDGGPKHLVVPGVTEFVAENDREFIQKVLEPVSRPGRVIPGRFLPGPRIPAA